MTFKEMTAVMFACILANNYVLSNFMGIEAVGFDISKSYKSIFVKGLELTLSIVVSSVVTWVLNSYLLVGALESLRILVTSIVVLAVTGVVGLLFKDKASCGTASCGNDSYANRDSISSFNGFDIPTALNSIILGALLLFSSNGYSCVTGILASIGVGIGYIVATLVISGVVSRINMKYVPKAWRGFPIIVASIAIVSLVLFAF